MLRVVRPELVGRKLAYGGRLDPMATGLLLVLGGDQLTHQEDYWNLGKEYEAQVLLGLTTDSYDLLGLVDAGAGLAVTPEHILAATAGLVGKLSLPVPAFSSAHVGGKPMFAWVRAGVATPAPVRQMVVSEIQVTNITTTNADVLMRIIEDRISLVHGDFRQAAILERWKSLLDATPMAVWPTVSMTVRCGSGTYIRSLAHELGQRLGTGAVLSDLRRTRIGPWSVTDPEVIGLSWPR